MALPNIVVRILTGAVFVAAILCGILFNQYIFLACFAVLLIFILSEFYSLIGDAKQTYINKPLNIIGGLLLFGGAFVSFSEGYNSVLVFAPYVLYLLILFISVLYRKNTDALSSLAYSVLGQFYIAVPFSLLNYIAFSYKQETYHYVFLLALFVLIWVNDSFAYLVGSKIGKNRLFERISPKKSWEGSVGGAVFTLLATSVFAYFYTEMSLWGWLGLGIAVIVFGTLGDLIESLFKRTIGVKDSGNILPGHGGFLDRFDSVLFAIPALFVYLEIRMFFQFG
ncbi:phosphatidate cytidylyltransferase [Dysgonomonas sp. PH5-45]|uniref:phosphatidate cytidylyltransferase n=1 Tax=unclassified Dysgonomonas TaxID=2630389 RepID=UPI0024759EA9|nr:MULTISPECIES: phosphatidate cytidylyltransferase [unclassified Dysgonomonas]MDH6354363.1 phosphatidate cytidylyltransferase [Dysgonomonas sp. PH5-45]MDH6387263.1 phosphatidate cytidylyltransferase [Dysgonomonas sp. PH5-37]